MKASAQIDVLVLSVCQRVGSYPEAVFEEIDSA
jgi:hypothetical protein